MHHLPDSFPSAASKKLFQHSFGPTDGSPVELPSGFWGGGSSCFLSHAVFFSYLDYGEHTLSPNLPNFRSLNWDSRWELVGIGVVEINGDWLTHWVRRQLAHTHSTSIRTL